MEAKTAEQGLYQAFSRRRTRNDPNQTLTAPIAPGTRELSTNTHPNWIKRFQNTPWSNIIPREATKIMLVDEMPANTRHFDQPEAQVAIDKRRHSVFSLYLSEEAQVNNANPNLINCTIIYFKSSFFFYFIECCKIL